MYPELHFYREYQQHAGACVYLPPACDFSTFFTIFCSSIRKARTILRLMGKLSGEQRATSRGHVVRAARERLEPRLEPRAGDSRQLRRGDGGGTTDGPPADGEPTLGSVDPANGRGHAASAVRLCLRRHSPRPHAAGGRLMQDRGRRAPRAHAASAFRATVRARHSLLALADARVLNRAQRGDLPRKRGARVVS